MLDIVPAFAAGMLTIAAPCVLPMLPIILGASVGHRDPARPIFITGGFAATFVLVAFLFGVFPSVLGLSQDTLRNIAVGALLLFGALMIWPHPFELLTARMSALLNQLSDAGRRTGPGNFGVLVLGASLGAVWVPCAGPVLGSIMTLIASAESLERAAMLLACYSAGAAVSMLLIAYGGQYVSTRVRRLVRYTRTLQQGLFAALYHRACSLGLSRGASPASAGQSGTHVPSHGGLLVCHVATGCGRFTLFTEIRQSGPGQQQRWSWRHGISAIASGARSLDQACARLDVDRTTNGTNKAIVASVS